MKHALNTPNMQHKQTRRHALPGVSLHLILLAALTGCQPEVEQGDPLSEGDCGAGRLEHLEGGVYCIYQQPIIETRFDCPAFAPHFSRHDAQTVVCGSTAELPDGFDDLISMDPGAPIGGGEEPIMQGEADMAGGEVEPEVVDPTQPVSEPETMCEHGFGGGCQDAIDALPGSDPYGAQSLAIRLAELLWDDAPDAALLQAASGGALATRSGVHAQVDRMMQDPRFEQHMDAFWVAYLGLEHLQGTTASLDASHPLYTPTLASSLLSSALGTIRALTLEDELDVRDVWTSQKILLNEDIAPYYGMQLGGSSLVEGLMPETSSGILTHPALLTGSASISTRGAAALSQLCVQMPAPPPDVEPIAPEQPTHLTYRQSFEAFVSAPECAACHAQLDAPGFALYGFDAMGQRLGLDEDGQAFDTSGDYEGQVFADTKVFAGLFRDDVRLSSCVTTRLYEHLGQGVTALDASTIAPVIHGHLLQAGTFTMRDLVRALATSDTMLYRP